MFKKIFIELCASKGISPSAVCKNIGISAAAFSQWDDNTVPRKVTQQKIADYFGVSVDYLLGKENASSGDEWTIKTEQEKVLLTSFRSTTEEGRQRIIQSVLNICDSMKSEDK